MRAVIQRVTGAKCIIDGALHSEIGAGFLVLLGVEEGDGSEDAAYLAGKIARLRVMEDENGKMNLSLLQTGGEILAVSQFTLAADCRRGNRPSFASAMRPEQAEPLYESFVEYLRKEGVAAVRCGVFGADMKLDFVNDGPVTIWMDTKTMR